MTVSIDVLLGIQLLKWIPPISTIWIVFSRSFFNIYSVNHGLYLKSISFVVFCKCTPWTPSWRKAVHFEVTHLLSHSNHSIVSFSELLNGITTSCMWLYNKRNYCISEKHWAIRNRASLRQEMTVPFSFQIVASDLLYSKTKEYYVCSHSNYQRKRPKISLILVILVNNLPCQ